MGRSKVLFVEDDEALRNAYARMIEREGEFDVHGAGTIGEAIEASHQSQFDLTLLDLNLPDSVGIETVELARKHLPEPIVILTGVYDPNGWMMNACLAAGATDWIEKDANPKFIVRILEIARAKAKMRNSVATARAHSSG